MVRPANTGHSNDARGCSSEGLAPEVAQDRVNRCAEATDEHQGIHVDVERTTRELGGAIADPAARRLGHGGTGAPVGSTTARTRCATSVGGAYACAPRFSAPSEIWRPADQEGMHGRNRRRDQARLHHRDALLRKLSKGGQGGPPPYLNSAWRPLQRTPPARRRPARSPPSSPAPPGYPASLSSRGCTWRG